MFRHNISLAICLLACIDIGHAQNRVADLDLNIQFIGFEDGVVVGETGTMVVEITNNGPDSVDASSRQFKIGSWYRYTDNTINPFILFGEAVFDTPACEFSFPNIDPRPPVDGYILRFFLYVQTILAPNESFRCEANIIIRDGSFLATRFILSPLFDGGTDPILNNNEVTFIFRGQVVAVPLSIHLILASLLLVVTWAFTQRLSIQIDFD